MCSTNLKFMQCWRVKKKQAEQKSASAGAVLFCNHDCRILTSIRLFSNAPFETIICCNERTACTKCLSFTVMQFYVVLLGDWVNGPDSSPQSICVPHPVLKWDNVLYSLRQVAGMTLLPYPLNVSIIGIKWADNWAAKQSKCCDCDPSSLEMHLWKHVLIETHLRDS